MIEIKLMMTHSSDSGTVANVPAFLTKLWKLVEDPNYDHLIHWSQNGKSFIISNQGQFAKELLPLYFKHNNMASFIRQLNMYGFRKLTNIENSGLRSERDDIEFYHVHFVKDQESSLELIKRKIKTPLQVSAAKSIDENEVRHDDVGSILVDVKAIKGKQDTVDNILVNMQKENEALWREIAILRRKYQKQQHIVEKLLQFLLSLVQQRGIGVKRKSPLMIGLNETSDANGEFSKSKRLAKDDQMDTLNSSLGPLIFDVSDDMIEEELEATANNCPIIATAELSPLCVKSDSPVDNILNSDQIVDSNDAVEALLNPIQSVIDSSIMAPDIDETVQLNGNSNLIDDSVTSIDDKAVEALFNPAIQSVIDSSLASNRGATLGYDGTNKSASPIPSTSTSASCTSTTPSNTIIDHPIMSLDSTDDNVVALLDPLQSAIESSIMQPTSDLTSTSNIFKNELTQSNADMIEQSMASMGNDDGNVDALLGSLQSLPLTIFDLDSISNNFV